MQITNFESPELENLALWLEENRDRITNKNIIKEVLKTLNISLVAEGINRIQTTLLCELKDSYVQQSQRYVAVDKNFYRLPDLEGRDNLKAIELMEEAFNLYQEMSQLKEGDFKGRPKAENYRYGIPIEDARYILPLAAKTNMIIAMTGDKLLDLFGLINNKEYKGLFDDFKGELVKYLPNNLLGLLNEYSSPSYNNGGGYREQERKIVEDFYQRHLKKLDEVNNMVYINGFENLDLKVGLGALTSTSPYPASQTLKEWGKKANTRARGVAERVLGYGHDSVAEQARTNFAMMCSMVTYHQQIRHRLSENYREDMVNIITDRERRVVLPKTIKESKFYKDFLGLVDKFKEFRLYIMKEYGASKALPFILNCDQIKLIISTNARIDTEMLADRICFNAQWEIRDLSIKKLRILRGLSGVLYEGALPSCIGGKCREGKLSCGRQQEMKDLFGKDD